MGRLMHKQAGTPVWPAFFVTGWSPFLLTTATYQSLAVNGLRSPPAPSPPDRICLDRAGVDVELPAGPAPIPATRPVNPGCVSPPPLLCISSSHRHLFPRPQFLCPHHGDTNNPHLKGPWPESSQRFSILFVHLESLGGLKQAPMPGATLGLPWTRFVRVSRDWGLDSSVLKKLPGSYSTQLRTRASLVWEASAE